MRVRRARVAELANSAWLLYSQPCAQSDLHPYPTLHLGRTGGTGDGTQPGGSRCDGVDIAQAALEFVAFEQHVRAGGPEQPVGRAQRIKSGEMTVTRDQLNERSRDRFDARLAGALDLADGAADQQPCGVDLGRRLGDIVADRRALDRTGASDTHPVDMESAVIHRVLGDADPGHRQ
jgi:hypothetical protein